MHLHLWTASQHISPVPDGPWVAPTYAANGQAEAHRVQHRGGDCAVVEGVLDAVVATEKAPLIGTDFTQVKGCQRQTSCGRRDQEEEEVREEGKKEQVKAPKWNVGVVSSVISQRGVRMAAGASCCCCDRDETPAFPAGFVLLGPNKMEICYSLCCNPKHICSNWRWEYFKPVFTAQCGLKPTWKILTHGTVFWHRSLLRALLRAFFFNVEVQGS